jgi:hypothetical protein
MSVPVASHIAHRLTLALIAFAALVPSHCASAAAPPVKPTLAAAEWESIKQVIGDQRSALVAGDAAGAFSHAAPGIRTQFGTPENFLAMVRAAYDALLAARYVEFLDGAVIEGHVIQPLRLVAPDNTVQIALYVMQRQEDGHWKIAGCMLAPSTVRAA